MHVSVWSALTYYLFVLFSFGEFNFIDTIMFLGKDLDLENNIYTFSDREV